MAGLFELELEICRCFPVGHKSNCLTYFQNENEDGMHMHMHACSLTLEEHKQYPRCT